MSGKYSKDANGDMARNSIYLSLIALAFVCISNRANTDWRYTSWGMTPEQVLVASAGKAYENDDLEGGSTDDAYALLKAPYSVGRFSFEASFLFDKVSLLSGKIVGYRKRVRCLKGLW